MTPSENLLKTLIRKAYPYANRLRNPMNVALGSESRTIHHGGSKDHYYAIYQCFYRHQYELPAPLFTADHHGEALKTFYDSIVAAGRQPLIIDCGANIGASALWFSARYPAARIIAVEPATDNLALLRRNLALPNITVVAGAVGPADGTAFLHGNPRSPLSFRVLEEDSERAVPVLSLQSLVATAPGTVPFILKIDIEGGEKTLFAGDTAAPARFPLIILEPHDFCMPGENVSVPFFTFHASEGRDFLFANENIFSLDYARLKAAST